jgi:quinoprotein glucose dehydrogenase
MRGKALAAGAIAAMALAAMVGAQGPRDVDWPAYAGDKASTKYSPLDQINADTVGTLQIAWRRSAIPEEVRAQFPEGAAPANYQHTPLMVGGLL